MVFFLVMSTLFTKIINQEIPSFKLLEDEHFYSFLDIRPISAGHSLVIPKQEVDHFYDMQFQDYSSGIYIIKVKSLNTSIEKKVTLIK